MLAKCITSKGQLLEDILNRSKLVGNCRVWLGCVNDKGYGVVRRPISIINIIPKETWLVHRLLYYLLNGIISNNILHRCDNPPCILDEHLFDGTQMQNIQDSLAKGRFLKGEKHGSALLTQEDVDYIRSCYIEGKAPYGTGARLSRELSISPVEVSMIKDYLRWK